MVSLYQMMIKDKLSNIEKQRIFSLVGGQTAEQMFLESKKLNLLHRLKYNFVASQVARGIPVQYFEKKAAFYGNDFIVTKNVLVPRPETETLVATAIDKLNGIYQDKDEINVVDVGTGSGCIAISTFKEFSKNKNNKKINFFATDLSKKALAIAKKNALLQRAEIKFVRCDLLNSSQLPEKFDLILANLPYLKPNYQKSNDRLKYEPSMALNGGKDGLEIIFSLIDSFDKRLSRSGTAILEIDPEQADMIESKYRGRFKITRIKDLNDRVRFVKIN